MKITIERKEYLKNCTKGAVYLNSMYKLCDSREPPISKAVPAGTYFLELSAGRKGKLVPYLLQIPQYPVSTISDDTRIHPHPGSIQVGIGRTKFPLEIGTEYLNIIVEEMRKEEEVGRASVITIRSLTPSPSPARRGEYKIA